MCLLYVKSSCDAGAPRDFLLLDVLKADEGGRRNYLLSVKTALAENLSRLRSIIAQQGCF